jgi:hypothetical protein
VVAVADLTHVAVDAWELGYAFAVELISDALDDARCAVIAPPRLSYEERVQRRIEDMERWADTHAEESDRYLRRMREHDRLTMARAGVR